MKLIDVIDILWSVNNVTVTLTWIDSTQENFKFSSVDSAMSFLRLLGLEDRLVLSYSSFFGGFLHQKFDVKTS